jgi:hypothetical protein
MERDVRRALAPTQAAFRRTLVRRLKRDLAAALLPESLVRDLATLFAATQGRKERVITITALNAALSRLCPRHTPACQLPLPGTLVPVSESTARRAGAHLDMHADAARVLPCYHSSHLVYAAPVTTGYGSRTRTLEKARRDNYVRSVALIQANPAVLVYVLHDTEHTLILPAGYLWAVDGNGVHILELFSGADYHPTATELAAKDAPAKLVASLVDNRAQRLLMKAQAAAQKAELEGVYACVADSIRAGNCRAGSEAFASRHGLSTSQHYGAKELLAIANGDVRRVRLVITAATLRHRREMAQGFADLAEHTAAK